MSDTSDIGRDGTTIKAGHPPDMLMDYHREMIAAFLPFDNGIREMIESRSKQILDPHNNKGNSAYGNAPAGTYYDKDTPDAPVEDVKITDSQNNANDEAKQHNLIKVTTSQQDEAKFHKQNEEYLSVSVLADLSKLEFDYKFRRSIKSTDEVEDDPTNEKLSKEKEQIRKVVRKGDPGYKLNSNGDGLCISSQGIGTSNVLSFFLQLYAHERNLVLLVNTSPTEVEFIKEGLMRIRALRGDNDILDTNPNMIKLIDTGTSPNDRKKIYLSGGVICASSRVLIVDLLNDLFPTDLLTGVLINHAHQITESSQEAFILTLIREKNKPAFFKAFSERPERFAHGSLWKLEESMRVLFMRHVFLWPRFHVSVSEALLKNTAIVTDVSVPLSRLMREIQEALLDCMKECLSELKRSSGLLDPDELTIENALFRNFTVNINQQLEQVSHRVSHKTKVLIKDLATLRSTIFYLLAYDCITFNEHLDNLRMQGMESISNNNSANQWLLLDASHTVFGSAKRRVYINDNEFPGIARFNIPKGISPILEEQPKWKALKQVLEQIKEETKSNESAGSILIMVDGDSACTQIRDYLAGFAPNTSTVDDPYFPENYSSTNTGSSQNSRKKKPKFSTTGSMEMMYTKLSRYFKWKAQVPTVATNLSSMNTSSTAAENSNDSKSMYGRINQNQQLQNKRRRVRGVTSSSNNSSNSNDDLVKEAKNIADLLKSNNSYNDNDDDNDSRDKDLDIDLGEISESPKGLEHRINDEIDSGNIPLSVNEYDNIDLLDHNNDILEIEADFLDNFKVIEPENMIIVRPYAETSASIRSSTTVGGDIDSRALEDIRPRYVIMVDANVGFIRRLEVYKALNPFLVLNVFFMTYINSVEEQLYLSALRKENFAFQKLIHQKANMVVPIDQDGRNKPVNDEDMWRNLDRRVAAQRNGLMAENVNDIIVDTREFRSKFPYKCHKAQLHIVPCMLEVGDYVLSPLICVERKSVPDLLQSFRSGRLYSQCEAMTLHYKIPILLIEFDKNKGFMLLGDQDLGSEIKAWDITSRISLLLLHFPKVRIIWAMNCDAGAEIFVDLKRNQEPPSVETAQSIGVESKELIDSVHSITPSDVLRALPGINDRNYKYVMSKVKNLSSLATMTLEELESIIGYENGQKLFDFLNKDSHSPN